MTACRDKISPADENGWTHVIKRIANKHNVRIEGVEGVDAHKLELRTKLEKLEAKRRDTRLKQFWKGNWGVLRPLTGEEDAEIMALEDQTQYRKGTGRRTFWMLGMTWTSVAIDFGSDGIPVRSSASSRLDDW